MFCALIDTHIYKFLYDLDASNQGVVVSLGNAIVMNFNFVGTIDKITNRRSESLCKDMDIYDNEVNMIIITHITSDDLC